ncbi:FAD-dependent oxidoreductase [Achromobacter xylosoxidans]
MAGQRDPAGRCRWRRHRRHRRRIAVGTGELEGRRQIVQYLAFLRAKVPGFEQAYVLDIAPQLGIRETRRIVGEYMLTQDDVLGCADFDDSIGVNGWPLEMHMAGDVKWLWPPIPESRGYNQLPYRMMLPRRGAGVARNVLVAALLRVHDARGPVDRARQRQLLRDGRGRRRRGGAGVEGRHAAG